MKILSESGQVSVEIMLVVTLKKNYYYELLLSTDNTHLIIVCGNLSQVLQVTAFRKIIESLNQFGD